MSVRACALLGALASLGCAGMSERIDDPSAGLNGGFEHVRAGLPLNWSVYTPATVPDGDFAVSIDEVDQREGRQSLKFEVRDCSPTGGRFSPGLTNEQSVRPGATYRVSCWVKNEGTTFALRAGNVTAKTGDLEALESSAGGTEAWTRFERTLTIPEGSDRLRFELGITAPGTLWIDDVRIEQISDGRTG